MIFDPIFLKATYFKEFSFYTSGGTFLITNLSEFIVCIVFFIVCNGMSEQPNTQKVNSKIALLAYHVSKKSVAKSQTY